jgi:hypothetical protein
LSLKAFFLKLLTEGPKELTELPYPSQMHFYQWHCFQNYLSALFIAAKQTFAQLFHLSFACRYVGELSLLLPEKRVARISVLDFWGNREASDEIRKAI